MFCDDTNGYLSNRGDLFGASFRMRNQSEIAQLQHQAVVGGDIDAEGELSDMRVHAFTEVLVQLGIAAGKLALIAYLIGLRGQQPLNFYFAVMVVGKRSGLCCMQCTL